MEHSDLIDDISLENLRPSFVEYEALLEMLKQQPSTSTYTLSARFSHSQNTISRPLHQLGLLNRHRRDALYELANDQVQRHLNICKQLLANSQDARFWRPIVSGADRSIYFRNLNKRNQQLRSG